jgi:mRNA (2'-O-methyladenosine-N6-)-methyltransferase
MDLLSDSPSFCVIGCGDNVRNLQLGRKLLREWGFRRAEDVVWLKKNDPLKDGKVNQSKSSIYCLQNGLFKSSKEHFLIGIKGTIKRN